MLDSHATAPGTAAYCERYPAARANGFYRLAGPWFVSGLGMGTYLGAADDATDAAYGEALFAALQGGINFIDTSLNYRQQRSERCVGAALTSLVRDKRLRRDEVVICSKAGYLVPGEIPAEQLRPDDIVAGMHCMAPAFLEDQLDRSRRNLGLETIDVYYLHNPETQLPLLGAGAFYDRIRLAFSTLERLARERRICYYGAATWDGFRKRGGPSERLSLVRLTEIAREEGGAGHHFRFVQLPLNLAMVEALSLKTEMADGKACSVLEVAAGAGLHVVASASLLQSRLAANLPAPVAAHLQGPGTDAQRALQFARSAPGVTVALAGMSKVEHVEENLGLAGFPPAAVEQYRNLLN